MKLAFYKAKRGGFTGLFDAVVRWWTRGPYSHVELVLDDGTCWSASMRDGGVRAKVINVASGNWDLVEIDRDPAFAAAWFEAHEKRGYDYLGLFGFFWRPYYGASSRFFCSEAVAASLKFRDPWRFDPNTLYAALLFGTGDAR